ncbi:MAG: SDR family oxidoreductase [Marinovum sp.]|nr:SDR family oxidoreductase [Marinovum sp.]
MGRRVIITGGASGIGAVMAARFAALGDRVAVCDLDAEALVTCPAEIAMRADVTSQSDMEAFLGHVEAEWEGADVVLSNAGIGGPAGPIETLDFEGWRATIASSLDGTFHTCAWAARVMKAQGSGVLLLTSSTSGLWGVPNRSPYVAAKWGIVGLMKTLAMELGPHGIRVNALCPGAVEGPRMERVLAKEAAAAGVDIETQRGLYADGVSLRSWVSADDIADTAIFLASDAARHISGQAMAIDGHTERMT